jgi:hypothetical protein
LKDHLDVPVAAGFPLLAGLEIAGGRREEHPPRGGVQEPGDDLAERRLARAGLADDSEHFARAQPEAHLIDRAQLLPVPERELDHQVVRGKHGPAGRRPRCALCPAGRGPLSHGSRLCPAPWISSSPSTRF